MMKKIYRVIIAGSRYYDDYNRLVAACDQFLARELHDSTCSIVVLVGGATGADSLGVQYAKEKNLKVEVHEADWGVHGRAAGPIRNAEMADVADALIAFPKAGEANKGTLSMIKMARRKGLLVHVESLGFE